MLGRAIALNPQAPLHYFDLGTVFLRLGQLEPAIGQFEAGLNLPLPRGAIPDLGLAIEELRRVVSSDPSPDGYNALGRMLGVAGADSPSVIAAFQEAIRLRPDYAEAYNSMGLVYVQTGEDEAAIAAFRKAIALRPEYADAHQNLGAVLTSSDAADAVKELEAALSLQPRLLKAQYNLALAYEASSAHGPAKASEQLLKLLAVEPHYPRAEFALGRSLLRQGKVSEAVEHLRLAVEQEPEHGEAHYQYGLALSRSGKRAEGAAEIQKSRELIAAGEKEQTARLDMAEASAAIDQGNPDQAIPKINRVIRTWPDAAEPHFLLGKALEKKGEPQQAIAEFRTTLEIDPAHKQAKAALDRLATPTVAGDDPQRIKAFEDLIRTGRFETAEGLLRAYVDERPRSSWAWYALAYSLYGQRKIGDSIKAASQSLQLNVKNAEAHKLLGRDLMIIGRFDAAKVEFEQGAIYDPKSPEMPYNLGRLCSIQDNWPDAKRHFESAIRLDPGYMEAYDGLGLALESLGDDVAATTSYKKSIELNEARNARFYSPYVNLSSLSNRTGNRDTALEYARKALEVNPKADGALFQMAKAHEAKGDLNAAAEALNQAIEINPRISSYFYVLGTVYRKLGRFDESKTAMESFRKLDRESNELEQKRRNLAREGERAGPPQQSQQVRTP
jgi:tetratricopeptide (TPR) repeat protein